LGVLRTTEQKVWSLENGEAQILLRGITESGRLRGPVRFLNRFKIAAQEKETGKTKFLRGGEVQMDPGESRPKTMLPLPLVKGKKSSTQKKGGPSLRKNERGKLGRRPICGLWFFEGPEPGSIREGLGVLRFDGKIKKWKGGRPILPSGYYPEGWRIGRLKRRNVQRFIRTTGKM